MSHVLMLCHDQHLDRRVVAQAESLIISGHQVTLLALSFSASSESSETPEGIRLVRVGLNQIVPANPVYKGYIARQQSFNSMLNALCNRAEFARKLWTAGFRAVSRLNWTAYRASLLAKYRNRHLSDPLPFTSAFFDEGIRHTVDIVQVHDLPTLEAGTMLADRWNVPLVYDAHELYPEQRSFSNAQKKVCSEAESQLIKKANLVFAVNDSIAEEMAKRYEIPRPITLLNAIDPPREFSPTGQHDLLRQKLALPAERRILLFQGGFAPHRNLGLLIEAMALVRTPDVDLVMMGFGDYGSVLKNIAMRKNLLGKRVHFLPAVPQSELLQHSASADIGIIPYPHVDLNSLYCTPNKLFEFIQAALPILANASPELERFVAKENFGVAMPMHTSEQIASAVDSTFASGQVNQWKKSLLDKRQRFAWSVQSQIYLNAMRPFLGETLHCHDAQGEIAA